MTEEPGSSYVTRELNFINYLVANALYDDALFMLYKLEESPAQLNREQLDSIHYYKGWLNYFSQEFDMAIEELAKVDSSSGLFTRAVFYRFFCLAYQQEHEKARAMLEPLIITDNAMLKDFKNFQMAGISLLLRDYEAYEAYASQLSESHYLFASEEQQQVQHYQDLVGYKKKSRFLAALFSALVPGLGKYYAGYRGLPFGAALLTFPLAAVAVEALIIAGLLSPQFLILGSLFAVFYIGNIWGSAISVTAKKREDYAQIDYNILYDMHVSLRRVFE